MEDTNSENGLQFLVSNITIFNIAFSKFVSYKILASFSFVMKRKTESSKTKAAIQFQCRLNGKMNSYKYFEIEFEIPSVQKNLRLHSDCETQRKFFYHKLHETFTIIVSFDKSFTLLNFKS